MVKTWLHNCATCDELIAILEEYNITVKMFADDAEMYCK